VSPCPNVEPPLYMRLRSSRHCDYIRILIIVVKYHECFANCCGNDILKCSIVPYAVMQFNFAFVTDSCVGGIKFSGCPSIGASGHVSC